MLVPVTHTALCSVCADGREGKDSPPHAAIPLAARHTPALCVQAGVHPQMVTTACRKGCWLWLPVSPPASLPSCAEHRAPPPPRAGELRCSEVSWLSRGLGVSAPPVKARLWQCRMS